MELCVLFVLSYKWSKFLDEILEICLLFCAADKYKAAGWKCAVQSLRIPIIYQVLSSTYDCLIRLFLFNQMQQAKKQSLFGMFEC